MGKQKPIVFRSAAGGYNKRDVNQFIVTMNANFAAAEEGYKKEISLLKDELKQVTETAEQGKIKETENEILRAETEALRLELEALRAENASLSAIESMPTQPQISAEEIEQLRKKAELYDTMSSQFGNVLISANHEAECIVAAARQDAEQSLGAAKATITQSTSLLSTRLDELYRSASTHAADEIQSTVYAVQQLLSRVLTDLSRRRTQLDEVLKRSNEEVRATADEQIAQMVDQVKTAVSAVGTKKESASISTAEKKA